jgi:RHS repeat-associated protein
MMGTFNFNFIAGSSAPGRRPLAPPQVVGLGGEQLTEMGIGDANSATTSSSANSSTTALTWQHANIWAGGKLLGTYDKDGLHFYFDDPLAGVPTDRSSSVGWFGTRRAQTDAFGVIEQTCSSLPYGDALACSSQPDNATAGPSPYLASLYAPTEHHFTGKERDQETGNDYFEARYYNSAMGRFMSPDWSAKIEPVPYAKLDFPQSLNLYAYMENNPLGGIDADGHGGDDQSSSGPSTNQSSGQASERQSAPEQSGPQYHPMNMSAKGRRFLECQETNAGKPNRTIYPDSKGNQTIGYGHMLTKGEIKSGIYSKGITEKQGGWPTSRFTTKVGCPRSRV